MKEIFKRAAQAQAAYKAMSPFMRGMVDKWIEYANTREKWVVKMSQLSPDGPEIVAEYWQDAERKSRTTVHPFDVWFKEFVERCEEKFLWFSAGGCDPKAMDQGKLHWDDLSDLYRKARENGRLYDQNHRRKSSREI